jgi:hypothetical protein
VQRKRLKRSQPALALIFHLVSLVLQYFHRGKYENNLLAKSARIGIQSASIQPA